MKIEFIFFLDFFSFLTLFEVVCLSALLPPSLALLVRGFPFKVAAQQFQSKGGEMEEKIQFFLK